MRSDIEKAVVIFDDTGEVQTLSVKSDSSHHFFDRFMVDEDVIQLRLDWDDLDSKGRPTLDADFIDSKTEKHRKLKGERWLAHHTCALTEDGRCYQWVFKECNRKFRVAITWGASVAERAHASDACEAEVIRASSNKRE